MYLEHYLDSIENLPFELQRNFQLMRDLDQRTEDLKSEIDKLATEYISNARMLSSEEKLGLLKQIQEAYGKCKEFGDDKVQLAMQTYEMVDKHIRRLDTDLARFEADLKEKQIESSDYDSSSSKGKKKGRAQKEKKAARARSKGKNSDEEAPKTAQKKLKLVRTSTEYGMPSVTFGNVHPSDVLDMPVDPNEPTYCLCHQVSYGEMIGCDNPDCSIEWFHFACVGLDAPNQEGNGSVLVVPRRGKRSKRPLDTVVRTPIPVLELQHSSPRSWGSIIMGSHPGPKLFKGRHQENKKAKTGGSTQEQKGVMEELSEQIIAQPAANNWKNPGFPFFLSQLIPRTLSSDPGSPLTEDEYEVFFSALRPEWKASMMCQTRRSKGCQSPKIKQLDEFENHGQIPEGPICADLPQIQRFETFCLFAQFRCLDQKFYIKRIMCPIAGAEETTSISAETAQLLDLLETSVKPTEESAPHTEAQVSSPPDGKELLSDIDTLLKYSFAVSGQEPEPQEDFPTVTASEGVLQAPVHEDHPHQPKAISDTDAQETEEIKETDQPIPTIIHHSESTDFPSEEVESTEAAEGTRELHVQEDPPGTESKGRLLDLEKDDAVLILCFAVLEDICVSSVVSKAWKEMEDKILGYGSLVNLDSGSLFYLGP
uniref:Uncharacterized protein n=1 Tax=Sphaerodactylus townsendi TaxID=933632 RepID=A0ACB8ERX1_9SAUR